MKYLVLKPFRSYGIGYKKGEILDEKLIRSPYLRRSEGKIIPAVSSANVPDVADEPIEAPAQSTEDDDTKVEGAQTTNDQVAETPHIESGTNLNEENLIPETILNDKPITEVDESPEKFDIVAETNAQAKVEPVTPALMFTQPSN